MVTVVSDIPTAHGGSSHVTIRDLLLPGNIVWYAVDVTLPSGEHGEWRFGYTRLHAREEADAGHVVTPETFSRLIHEIVAQRLQQSPSRDYPPLVFGVSRPLPPPAFRLPDTEPRDYADFSFTTPLKQDLAEEYYGMLSGHGPEWTLEDFRRFRDEISHEAEREIDEENGGVMLSDG